MGNGDSKPQQGPDPVGLQAKAQPDFNDWVGTGRNDKPGAVGRLIPFNAAGRLPGTHGMSGGSSRQVSEWLATHQRNFPYSDLIYVACAHNPGVNRGAQKSLVVMLTSSGNLAVFSGGDRQGNCCSGRQPTGTLVDVHVSEITGASQGGAEGVEGLQCAAVKLSTTTRVVVSLLLVDGAATTLLAQIQALQGLAGGGEAPGHHPGPPSRGGTTSNEIHARMLLQLAALTGPIVASQPRGLGKFLSDQIGESLKVLGEKGSLSLEQEVWCASIIANGMTDNRVCQALGNALAPVLFSAQPALTISRVNFGPSPHSDSQVFTLGNVLGNCPGVRSMSFKQSAVSEAALTQFVEICRTRGGCQLSSLNLRGNPAIGNVAQILQQWPARPVVSLQGQLTIYSSVGMLQRLCLDNCKLHCSAAAAVLHAVLFHASNLKGLSMVRGVASMERLLTADVFMSALGQLLNTSQVLEVLDLSDCDLSLDFFPSTAKCPLQVLNLSLNHFISNATGLNALVSRGAASRSLQLLSLANVSFASLAPDITPLFAGMGASNFMVDLSGCGTVAQRAQASGAAMEDIVPTGGLSMLSPAVTAPNGPRMLLMRELSCDEACAVIESVGMGSCTELDLRSTELVNCLAWEQARFVRGVGGLFQTKLTSLNISKCKVGAALTQAIGTLATNTSLIHLDVSGCGDTTLAPAIAEALKTNRTLTSLNMKDNNIDFEGFAAIRKMFGGVNPQTGVVRNAGT